MLEVAGILGAHLAVACLHAAHQGELPLLRHGLGANGKRGLRWLALLTLLIAFTLARLQLGPVIAALVCCVALSLSGTLVVTLRPVAPRAVWSSTYVGALVALGLALGALL